MESKLPNISELFAAASISSDSPANQNESTEQSVEVADPSDHENDSPTTQTKESEDEEDRIDNIEPVDFSNNAALWTIPAQISSLQNYWIFKGCFIRLCLKNVKKCRKVLIY